MQCCCMPAGPRTFRLRHHHGEVAHGSVDVAEPAAVEAEDDGGFGDHRHPVAHTDAGRGNRRA